MSRRGSVESLDECLVMMINTSGKTLATTSTTSTLFQKLRMPSSCFRIFPGSQGCKCYKLGPVLLIYLHTHLAGVIPAINIYASRPRYIYNNSYTYIYIYVRHATNARSIGKMVARSKSACIDAGIVIISMQDDHVLEPQSSLPGLLLLDTDTATDTQLAITPVPIYHV